VEDPDFFICYENRGSGGKLDAHLATPPPRRATTSMTLT
jgi:hypothetical protein